MTNLMNTKKLLFAACLGAVAMICLPAEKLSGQAQDENPYSTAITMAVRSDTYGAKEGTSHSGIMDPVGLRADEQIAISLTVPSAWANYPVGITPVDGGEVFAPENLYVASNGTVSFAFKGGTTPGLYRVLVFIGSERYQLQLYVAKPSQLGPDCVNP
jgi:hypothetical protein